MLCGGVAAYLGTVCVLCAVLSATQSQSTQRKVRFSPSNKHLTHVIYSDVMFHNV